MCNKTAGYHTPLWHRTMCFVTAVLALLSALPMRLVVIEEEGGQGGANAENTNSTVPS